MTVSVLEIDALWQALGEVLDPEVPVLSVVDLGIVRDLRVLGDTVEVDITPTYSGCPALEIMERDITTALLRAGAARVQVHTVYRPAWTTNWISAEAKEKLRAYGIAPPGPTDTQTLIPLRRAPATCPFCGSPRTELRSEFGSTACKAIHFCNACLQPFEEFKAI